MGTVRLDDPKPGNGGLGTVVAAEGCGTFGRLGYSHNAIKCSSVLTMAGSGFSSMGTRIVWAIGPFFPARIFDHQAMKSYRLSSGGPL